MKRGIEPNRRIVAAWIVEDQIKPSIRENPPNPLHPRSILREISSALCVASL